MLLDQGAHNAFVDQPAQDHLHHIHIRFASDAQAVEEFGFQAQFRLHFGDGLAAAVDDHRLLAPLFEGLHRLGQPVQKGFVVQFVAADFEHNDIAVIGGGWYFNCLRIVLFSHVKSFLHPRILVIVQVDRASEC